MRVLAFAFLLSSVALAARAADEADLAARVEALQQEIRKLEADPQRITELERRLDLLAAEIEKSRTGGATAAETPSQGQMGLGPAASRVYRVERGVSIGGYGEALVQDFADERQDGAASGKIAQADFLRAVTYIGYKFSDTLLFNSEIEFEHGSTGKGGEVSVEFAYLDYQLTKAFGLRAGMVLLPVGFANELHEPTSFNGARRPEVESAILPSTWREVGAGAFGEKGPVQWRAFAVAGLTATGLTSSGIRGARQSGARSKAQDWGLSGRIDVEALPGLLVGASAFSGRSGQGAVVADSNLSARVSVFETHAQYQWRGLQLRGLGSWGTIDDAAQINALNKLTGKASVGEKQYGYYGEVSFDVASLLHGGRWSLVPFVRYEVLDTQDGVPAGFVDDPATAKTVLTAGLGVKPLPQVVLKLDYQRLRDDAQTGTNQWNVSLGYVF